MRIIEIALVIIIASSGFGLAAGCSDDSEGDDDTAECAQEGEEVPVIANPPPCCDGLILIPLKEPRIGIDGVCTAKCGNGICDEETESLANCHDDCI